MSSPIYQNIEKSLGRGDGFRCAGCGIFTPDRIKLCKCATMVCFRIKDGKSENVWMHYPGQEPGGDPGVGRGEGREYRNPRNVALDQGYGRPTSSKTVGRREGWRLIDNSTPKDTDILLAWKSEWPVVCWEQRVEHYGSARGGWLHGRATHWRPLLPNPDQEPLPTADREAIREALEEGLSLIDVLRDKVAMETGPEPDTDEVVAKLTAALALLGEG